MLRSIIKVHISLLIIFLLILVSGCADINKQSPTAPPVVNDESGVSSLDKQAIRGWHKEKLIRADKGGSLRLPGRAAVKVPPKALDEDTIIGVTVILRKIVGVPGDRHIEFIFEPEGLVFNSPVHLILSWKYFRFLRNKTIVLYYFNEDSGKWEIVDEATITRGDRYVSLDIEHFSRYAAAAQ